MDTLLPRLKLDLAAPAPADLRALFHAVDEVRLESGFGGGEHLIAEASQHPRSGFIGIEPFVNGMAKALAAIDERKLPNIRLHHGDATDMLAWLPDASLVRFDLLYPDPWPKRRHWKRRFVQDKSVAAIARIRAAGRRIPLRQRHSRLRRLDLDAAHARRISPGPPSRPTIGGSPGRAFPARAMRPRPSAKAACLAI
jgi:Predicted S-adenosylmethionine-dependent methyltransferase